MTAEELSEWREAMRLAKKDAAVVLGVSENAYLAMEAGRSRINTRTELACIAIWHRMQCGMRPWLNHHQA